MFQRFTNWLFGRNPGEPTSRQRSGISGKRTHGVFGQQSFGTGAPVDDSAQTHRGNERHWGRAGGQDINTIIEAQLVTQRNRARFEVRNNGYAAGIVSTYANDTVGKNGPRVQISSTDEVFNAALERCVEETFEVIGANGDPMTQLLKMNINQMFESGEFLEQEIAAPDPRSCWSRKLLSLEPDRLTTPLMSFADDSIRMGVEVDVATGKPIRYHVLRVHPGSNKGFFSPSDFLDPIPSEFMIHGFVRMRPGQARGIPWFSPTIENFATLRDARAGILATIEVASKFSVFIHTSADTIQPQKLEDEDPIWDLETGTASLLPEGWDAKGFSPTQPSTTYKEFETSILREMGAPFGMPLLKVTNDASGHNFSSARLDQHNYFRNINGTRGLLETVKLDPVTRKIQMEASLSGIITNPPADGYKIDWIWPPMPQIDDKKEAEAATLRLAAGVSSLEDETMRLQGRSAETIMRKRAAENALAATLGLPAPHSEASASEARAGITPSILDDLVEQGSENRIASYLNGGGND